MILVDIYISLPVPFRCSIFRCFLLGMNIVVQHLVHDMYLAVSILHRMITDDYNTDILFLAFENVWSGV